VSVAAPRQQPHSTPATTLRIGFVPLLDAAPLIAAHEQGYFADEGLRVVLDRQIGWGNIRDRLTYGQLHAAHALFGMPLFSVMGRDWFSESLTALMNLGCGADAITFGRRLIDAGVNSSASLARFVHNRRGQPVPVLAHVFNCSVHHYLLRAWLDAAGVNPSEDVRLCVIPPPLVERHMAKGYLDGFCVGEPWNTLAASEGAGQIVALTSDIVPAHPDKVLAVQQRWAAAHPEMLPPLVRAALRGMRFCDDPRNADALAAMLARPEYIGVSASVIRVSLALPRTFVPPNGAASAPVGPANWRRLPFDAASAFPSTTQHAWLAKEMVRWGHLSIQTNVASLASRCVISAPFREAAAALSLECPDRDDPPMRLRNGFFTADAGAREGESFAAAS
jgi:ABC-type nitrate/sulfonate/bicarbonate transport system substrate-binding protein